MEDKTILSQSKLFRQIVREEFKSFTLTEQNSNVTPWKNVAAENFIKSLSSVKDNGADLRGQHSYITTVKTTKGGFGTGTGKDQIKFWPNGEAYIVKAMQTFKWKFANGKLTIVNPETGKVQGSIQKGNSGVDFWIISAAAKDAQKKPVKTDADDESTWSDYAHTGLDLLGIVDAFGIGPVADLINAAWYMAEGETFEAVLSVIGAIPVIGSALALPIKAAAKGIHLVKLNKLMKAGNSVEIWTYLVKNDLITAQSLKKLSGGLESLENILPGAKKLSKEKLPDALSRKVTDALDELDSWLRNNSKSIDELLDVSKKTGLKKPIVGITTPHPFKEPGRLRKFIGALSFNIGPKLMKSPWWPTKQLDVIARAMRSKFAKIYGADPTKLSALTKLTPNASGLYGKLDDIVYNKITDLPNAIQAMMRNINSPNDLRFVLKTLQDSSHIASKELYTNLSNKIINTAIDNDSLAWSIFKSDIGRNLQALFTESGVRTAMDAVSTQFVRHLPLIWNELEDIGDSIGIDKEDDPNGIIYPLICKGLGIFGADPDPYVKKIKDTEIGKMLIDTGKQIEKQVAPEEEADYDPSKFKVVN